MKETNTEVISFRVPKETAERIDKQAKKVKKKRAQFVKSIFLPTFEILADNGKAPAKTAA
jgi:predicted DNA-binding protein